ncbi:deoxyguanosinetriphosphate triphosphohydrolase [Alicycliphilus denitrificans]|uniref:deoxyguanosinetriphosphate triphosphohydrolase n=1 Tax=Alicycliphilus denitrificans TaxID=179636 RepID=UPI003A80A61D
MEWNKLLSTQKFKVEDGQIAPYRSSTQTSNQTRSEYHQDHDRVVFSRAFRRLGRKTQVHPLAQNDHTHNRLTHSVEVAAVGRSIGIKLGEALKARGALPEPFTPHDIGAIVQVACLAHDIGNPPFGHTGEDALREWFRQPENQRYLEGMTAAEARDLQTYEGNAHALRIICTTEMYTGLGGMRLSCASIGTLLKYPWTSEESGEKGKFNIYQSELPYFKAVANELGLKELEKDCRWARHPLSYLMEAADDICYSVLDLEDAVEMSIISTTEFEEKLQVDRSRLGNYAMDPRQRCAALRSIFIGDCVEHVSSEFMRNLDSIMEGEYKQADFFQNSSAPCALSLKASKEFARERIYTHPSKIKQEIGAYPCLHHLLSMFIPAIDAVHRGQDLSERQQRILRLLDKPPQEGRSKYQAFLEVLDFIGGMTDNYAMALARDTSGF